MSDQTNNLATLRRQSVKAIVAGIGQHGDADLADLLALEQNDDNPRESLLEAIKIEQVARAARAAAVPAALADWLREDYTGPLTGDQAQRRLRRYGQHVVKPAAPAETK